MNENWCILAIAALYERPCTIEQAFEVFDKGKLTKNKKNPKRIQKIWLSLEIWE